MSTIERNRRPLLFVPVVLLLVVAGLWVRHELGERSAADPVASGEPREPAPGASRDQGGPAPDALPADGSPTVEADDTERIARAEKLARLCDELRVAGDSSWTIAAGCPRVPTIPAAMAGLGSRLFVATEDRVETYDADAQAWDDEPIRLPERVGTGVALTDDGSGAIFVTSGGDRLSVWKISLADRVPQPLPEPPQPIGRGAALAYSKGVLYLAPGRRTDDFLALESGGTAWRNLGRIGGPAKVVTTFGRNAGFLAELQGGIVAAPDHHLQRYLVDWDSWGKGVWLAMGFRASLNGGGFAADDEVGSIYAACGMYSRSLNEIVPVGTGGAFHYLRPRIPYPMIGEGDRVAIARTGGVPHLFVYAVEPDNKLCSIPCAELVRLDNEDNVADAGSLWRRVNSPGGGSGIRRRAEVGPRNELNKAPGTMAAMGALDGELFFMRLANVRRIEPETGTFTYYPGVNVGAYLEPGCAGVYDDERFLYMCAGGSDYFVRWDVPTTPPEQKRFSGTRQPVDQTDLDVLPAMPAKASDGAALAHFDGMIYALRGAATREFWRFVVAEQRWEILPPLPPEARAPGELGTGLVANASGVYAVPDQHVWRYDVEAARWSHFAELAFGPDWDGGMVTNDGEQHVYVFKGGISTRFGRLDLDSGRFEELLPRPPDTLASEGNRLAIMTVAGERRLYVHRGHNSNEILWIRLADLSALDD